MRTHPLRYRGTGSTARDKPWYCLGHGIVLAYIALKWLCSHAYIVFLRQENDARDSGTRDEVIGDLGDP